MDIRQFILQTFWEDSDKSETLSIGQYLWHVIHNM